MNILIRGDKIEVTKSISDYVTEKLKKIDKYLENPDEVKATVVINAKNYKQKVEITIPLKNFILRAEETQEDLYSAVDIIIDKIERQIRKNKTKIQARKSKEVKEIVFPTMEEVEEQEEQVVVKRKKIDVKPMSEEEAILQMELLGHQFYLFRDAETLKPTVVYKRKDNDYGIIETE